jgi:hypothetical protein
LTLQGNPLHYTYQPTRSPIMIRIRDILFSIAFGLAIGALIAAGI